MKNIAEWLDKISGLKASFPLYVFGMIVGACALAFTLFLVLQQTYREGWEAAKADTDDKFPSLKKLPKE